MDNDTHKANNLFHDITADDWRRSIAMRRAHKNKVSEQIKARTAELKASALISVKIQSQLTNNPS